MLLIGSKALIHWGEEYLSQAKRQWDNDWICTYDDFKKYKKDLLLSKKIKTIVPLNKGKKIVIHEKNGTINEFEIAWDGSSKQLLDLVKTDLSLAVKIQNTYISTPNLIFTLKKSHRYLKDSPHFLKTMLDYQHLKSLKCVVPESLKDWYKLRVKETYWYKHPNLNVSKKDFFKDDKVPYIYDHDTIHLAMAHLDRPAYEYFKEDAAEVKCSKDLFFDLPEKTRLYAVLEESYVLALERSQIPTPGVLKPAESFKIALTKLCSSISSGWFREYAYDNYFKVLDMYEDNYVDKFWQGVKSGIVKKINN